VDLGELSPSGGRKLRALPRFAELGKLPEPDRARQLKVLAEREGEETVRAWHLRVAEHLIQPGKPLSNYGLAAKYRDAAGDRAGALELYDRWAMALRDRHAYSACLQIAQEGMNRFPIGDEEPERTAVANLWLSVHDALAPLGKISEAEAGNLQWDVTLFYTSLGGSPVRAKFE
jgi:hypothetical protein